MAKRLSYKDVKGYIESFDYILLSDTYKNANTKLKVRCPKGHEYEVKFQNFKYIGQRCPICYGYREKYSYEEVKQYIESFDYTLLSDTYKSTHTKIKVRCPKGHEYKVKFNTFQQGHRCAICKKCIKYSYDQVKEYIESFDYTLLSDTYKNANTKLKVRCPKGHEYEVSFSSFKNQGCRCLVCSGRKKHSYDDVKRYVEKEGYTLLSDTYENNKTKLKIRCDKGHEYEVNFGKFKNQGNRCPICWAESTSSRQEKEVVEFVKSVIGNNIEVINNDRTQIINPLTNRHLELDIWIPELNKAIEYNGIYWHSFNKPNSVRKDKIKRAQCKEKGIDLLVIEERNWTENQEMEMKRVKKWLKNGHKDI